MADMTDIMEIGASRIDEKSGQIFAQVLDVPIGDDQIPEQEVQMVSCLGVLARPAPANSNGSARGVITSVTGQDVLIGATDVRTTEMAGDLDPGDTAILGTSTEHQCRTVYKKQRVVTLVGDDMIFDMDRESKSIMFAAFKQRVTMSERDGIVLSADGATLQIKGGQIILDGVPILGGRTPKYKALGFAPIPNLFLAIPPVSPTTPPTPVNLSGVFLAAAAFLCLAAKGLFGLSW